MLATVIHWSLRVAAVLLVSGLLCVALVVVWSEGPTWWAALWSPVIGFLWLGAAVWMADNL